MEDDITYSTHYNIVGKIAGRVRPNFNYCASFKLGVALRGLLICQILTVSLRISLNLLCPF